MIYYDSKKDETTAYNPENDDWKMTMKELVKGGCLINAN
jgi:hypothetical protein